jgi:hypothetical protein
MMRPDGTWIRQEPYGKDWEGLLHWGPNGTLSVVAALYFWGCAVRMMESPGQEIWQNAVEDVAWMLEGLALFHESFKRRR